jgi:hypothetical protein
MSGFTNKSFDDTDPLIKYSPPELWQSDTSAGNGLYNDTITSDIVEPSLTFVNPQLQNISFVSSLSFSIMSCFRESQTSDQSQTFPEKAIAFYYYGSSSAFTVCIDTCDGPDGSTVRDEINTTAVFENDIVPGVMKIIDGTLWFH